MKCLLLFTIPWKQSPDWSANPVIPTELDRLAREGGGELSGPQTTLKIERVCADSRGAAPGSLFIALRGQRTDGHAFLADAFLNGASAAMVAQSSLSGLRPHPDWPLIVVRDPLRALQTLARRQRRECFQKV